jgi:endonuclease/exonuclease/phosphatase family metal-dependent hydrolase
MVEQRDILKVMTLNVRQPDQDDGPNNWEHRRGLLVETILAAGPDLIGTQELFQLQADYIQAHAPGYQWFGTGRFGDHRDKHVGIFYKPEKLQLVDHGDFWLSETPGVPGSSSWGIIRPRQVTWGLFEDQRGQRFHHFNTHFPYRKEEQRARENTAALLTARVELFSRVILTGDFNSTAGGDIHGRLTEVFQDAWLTADHRVGPESTLHGFGKVTGLPRRIDWILYRAPWKVLKAETIATVRDGIYPSDHYPVLAIFETGKRVFPRRRPPLEAMATMTIPGVLHEEVPEYVEDLEELEVLK